MVPGFPSESFLRSLFSNRVLSLCSSKIYWSNSAAKGQIQTKPLPAADERSEEERGGQQWPGFCVAGDGKKLARKGQPARL